MPMPLWGGGGVVVGPTCGDGGKRCCDLRNTRRTDWQPVADPTKPYRSNRVRRGSRGTVDEGSVPLPTEYKAVRNYSGRGIKVCDRWLEFQAFLADMGERPSKEHTIERVDVNGDYEPGNCVWVTSRRSEPSTVETRPGSSGGASGGSSSRCAGRSGRTPVWPVPGSPWVGASTERCRAGKRFRLSEGEEMDAERPASVGAQDTGGWSIPAGMGFDAVMQEVPGAPVDRRNAREGCREGAIGSPGVSPGEILARLDASRMRDTLSAVYCPILTILLTRTRGRTNVHADREKKKKCNLYIHTQSGSSGTRRETLQWVSLIRFVRILGW